MHINGEGLVVKTLLGRALQDFCGIRIIDYWPDPNDHQREANKWQIKRPALRYMEYKEKPML